MKITKQYLKQLIKEEMSRVVQEMESAGPDISHITKGALEPVAKPEYVGEGGDYYVYKFAYMFGANKPAQQHNFYGIFRKSDIDGKGSSFTPPEVQRYEIKGDEEKAKQDAMNFATGKAKYVPTKSKYTDARKGEINVGVNKS